jgi:predicted CopG family antitoxin
MGNENDGDKIVRVDDSTHANLVELKKEMCKRSLSEVIDVLIDEHKGRRAN